MGTVKREGEGDSKGKYLLKITFPMKLYNKVYTCNIHSLYIAAVFFLQTFRVK